MVGKGKGARRTQGEEGSGARRRRRELKGRVDSKFIVKEQFQKISL
jgi:hypothetical protein